MDDHARYAQLLAHAQQLQANGASQDEILAAVRRAWASPIQSIKVLKALYNIPLSEAKERLHASPAWPDNVPQWESLHAELEAQFERERDESDAARQTVLRDAITLYRPVGARELALIAETDFQAFPPRLPFQPIFYPVLTEAYATEIARDWNTKDEASDYHGVVLRFNIDAAFAARYPVRMAGAARHQELWVPAEELEDFNRHILGRIDIVAEFHGARPDSGARAS